jgi:hypothetical protein
MELGYLYFIFRYFFVDSCFLKGVRSPPTFPACFGHQQNKLQQPDRALREGDSGTEGGKGEANTEQVRGKGVCVCVRNTERV